jgi:hypothetical protein
MVRRLSYVLGFEAIILLLLDAGAAEDSLHEKTNVTLKRMNRLSWTV